MYMQVYAACAVAVQVGSSGASVGAAYANEYPVDPDFSASSA